MSGPDPRTPVLVGVGTSYADAESVDLMTFSTRDAARDAGAPSLLGAVDRIAVPQGTWSYPDPAASWPPASGPRRRRPGSVGWGCPSRPS